MCKCALLLWVLKIIMSVQCSVGLTVFLKIIAIDDSSSLVLDRKLLICVLKVDVSFSETHF